MVSLNDKQDGHIFSKSEQWSSYENLCDSVNKNL